MKITAVIGVVLLVLSGCGQRGPLYSPQENPENTAVPATPTASEIATPAAYALPTYKGA
jgi:predicted small lipoprotein YifL